MSIIDVSGIDETKPIELEPTTSSVRDNFSAIKTELTKLIPYTNKITIDGSDTIFGGAIYSTEFIQPNGTATIPIWDTNFRIWSKAGIGGWMDAYQFTLDTGVSRTTALNIDFNQKATFYGNVSLTAGKELSLDRTTDDDGFINFQATIDADATSAISSFTTSAATTHHIQILINGTPAWIAVSTTDPTA